MENYILTVEDLKKAGSIDKAVAEYKNAHPETNTEKEFKIEVPANVKLEEILIKLVAAQIAGDSDSVLVLIGDAGKYKAEIAKAKADSLKKEIEALSGTRTALAEAIMQAVKKSANIMALVGKLESVKAHGFTFNLDEKDEQGVLVEHKSVALLVPVVKTTGKAKSKDGTKETPAKKGSTLDVYGKTLDQIAQLYGTEADKANLEAIKADTANTAKQINRKSWVIKDGILKAAVEAGLLKAK